ncbi:MAG TPA: UDP-N-acetylglucosamine--N-acetylmuramyl-(pentapeptide) pyrophosphoryl-undecaprenol N-acetylglucosamine transferase [Opitutales bacterium]|jgi:UDP-N-acetylglucosamine--N-acetylmuramyl-(pentapeptide) pyrophosphoryl-undecaprenol N-acetylglucosamine transferase|nr:UDP-N-acetylglucosamine--N-acetylmuramyl-(pentapeptide) pyrophosphoryl-undecaprenol N-acetylglucosamine transferase [Opitutales bacterium]
MSNFAIACGGTGGHLSPGIALAERLAARGHKLTLLISKKEVDSRLIRKYPQMPTVIAPGTGFGLAPAMLSRFMVSQAAGFLTALKFLQQNRPDVIVGFGGFMTVGITTAGYFRGIPVVLHESNRKPGRSVRLLSGFSRRIYLPPGVRLRGLPPQALRHCGFPVRQEIRPMPKDAARIRMGLPVDGKVLLVLGGSQGARTLNKWLANNFGKFAARGISVICVTGPGKGSEGQIECADPQGKRRVARMIPFCDDMAALLSCADLTVSRAGAGSLAEFIRCRLPAILVPYPYAADNHQWENARYFERQGGGLAVDQTEMERLADEVLELMFNEFLLESFRRNLERMEHSNSLDVLLRDLEDLAAQSRQFAAQEMPATV